MSDVLRHITEFEQRSLSQFDGYPNACTLERNGTIIRVDISDIGYTM